MRLVKPLFNQIDGTLKSAILAGELEVSLNPTLEERAEYTRPLQEARLQKLKQSLTKQRTKMYKKDHHARLRDIEALERGYN